MGTMDVMRFYFPAHTFRRHALSALADRMPKDVAERVWESTARLQRELMPTRPNHAPGLNLIFRYMEWATALYRSAREEGQAVSEAGQLVEDVSWMAFKPACSASFKMSRLRSADRIARITWIFDVMFKVLFTVPFRRKTYPSASEVTFDVVSCPFATYFKDQGVPELTPYAACNLDYRMAAEWGLELHRAQTIAGGFPLCDFRFKASKRDVGQQQAPVD